MSTTQARAFRIDVEEAVALIAGAMPEFGARSVSLDNAIGCVLRQPVHAERDQPPFDRATMDGIAVAARALEAGTRSFSIAGTQAAGQPVLATTAADQCIETMTGAVMPEGCDTMIPVERITVANGTATLEDGYEATPGQFVHRRASDHRAGDKLLRPGCRIGGPELAILTAAGDAQAQVAIDPRIAIVSTGDELVDVGAPIEPHQIRSSNDRAIDAALQMHYLRNTTRARLPDEPDILLQEIRRLHDEHEVLILSGGVSMGKYDYVPQILEQLGVELIFHKILQRPGLPMWFGTSNAGKPVFALPGNPVSTLVCLVRYVRPAILTAMGLQSSPAESVQLAETVNFAPDLCWFLPVTLTSDKNGGNGALPRPTNTSGDFVGLRYTDGFVELPRGESVFPAGYAARLFRW